MRNIIKISNILILEYGRKMNEERKEREKKKDSG